MTRKLHVIDTGPAPGLGWHRHGDLLVCPQRYAYRHVLELPSAKGGKGRMLGSLLHVALAHHYAKLSPRAVVAGEVVDTVRLATPLEAMESVSAGKDGAPREVLSHAIGLWREYLAVWPPGIDRANWRVIAVETPLVVSIDGEPYGQRADLVAEYVGDDTTQRGVWVWDHKTLGGFGEAYGADQFTMSGQMLGLAYLGGRLAEQREAGFRGAPFRGVLLNMIRTKPVGAATSRFFRTTPPPAPDSASRFEEHIRQARRLRDEYALRDARAYPRALDATVCMAYGGCDYLQECRFGGGPEVHAKEGSDHERSADES